MALFVVIQDFTGPGGLHLPENAVIDDALYDVPGLQAGGLQVVAVTPALLAAIAAGAPASKAQIVENATAPPPAGGGGYGNKAKGDLTDVIVTSPVSHAAVPGQRIILDAAGTIATGTVTLPGAPTVADDAIEIVTIHGSGMTTLTVARNGNLINGFAFDGVLGAGTFPFDSRLVRLEFRGGGIGYLAIGAGI